ncbi:MAG: hypothetical protein ABW146_08935 [Candidatus Sedimenticola sp. 6PFRAG7]
MNSNPYTEPMELRITSLSTLWGDLVWEIVDLHTELLNTHLPPHMADFAIRRSIIEGCNRYDAVAWSHDDYPNKSLRAFLNGIADITQHITGISALHWTRNITTPHIQRLLNLNPPTLFNREIAGAGNHLPG